MHSENVSLCCCEYFDINQERNHILACCCNCTDLDEGFDSFIRGRGVPQQNKSAFMATLQDRIRIPWRGGAKQLSLDALLPIIVVPATLLVASQSLWWSIFAFTTMIVFLSYVSYQFMYCIPQTKFFFVWTIMSGTVLYIIFEYLVIPFLMILVEENMYLSILIAAFVICTYFTKTRATALCSMKENEAESGVVGTGGRNRAYNCSVCRISVPERDHHCVWFDCCIGSHNQCLFILSLLFCTAALLYSSNLTLTCVCHPFHFYKTILLPDDCTDAYGQFELGLSFVSAVYSLGIAVITFTLFLHQCLMVSLGVTGHEWRELSRIEKCCLGFTAKRPYSKGFFRNWLRIICCFKQQYALVEE